VPLQIVKDKFKSGGRPWGEMTLLKKMSKWNFSHSRAMSSNCVCWRQYGWREHCTRAQRQIVFQWGLCHPWRTQDREVTWLSRSHLTHPEGEIIPAFLSVRGRDGVGWSLRTLADLNVYNSTC
jgi:hypothetical protein